jgi:hypothetical protein
MTAFDAMIDVDIVVSSTGCPQTILHAPQIERVMSARRNRPLFMIDIAVPRDIDPDVQFLDNVYLYNIDHLQTLVRENVPAARSGIGAVPGDHQREDDGVNEQAYARSKNFTEHPSRVPARLAVEQCALCPA